ncbi:polysaccharide deacetylase family protein [Candidatus Saccharibacteria bacterium]|nr:polysaccharide deacetylase family protein [Candidatus Saccharibacteria bacterium]
MEESAPPKIHKSRHRWGLIMLSIVFFLYGIFVIGCFAEAKVLNDGLKVKPDNIAKSFCETSDEEAPLIEIIGSPTINVRVDSEYKDEGATATDSCDNVEVVAANMVDTSKVGSYKVTYLSVDNNQNKSEKTRTVNVIPKYHGTIYLTFDDGPGNYTNQLLDILKKYDVKATFFVTGYGDDEVIKREYDEGHAIGLHSTTHDYAYIYQNMDNFFRDLEGVRNRVYRITGYTSNLIRFPGGSSNTVSRRYDGGQRIMTKLAYEVERRGYKYFDWNISSGDAGEVNTSGAVYSRVVYSLKEYGDSVVLQHDVKNFSVNAVEEIIKFGLNNGYEFKKLDETSPTAHHRINN